MKKSMSVLFVSLFFLNTSCGNSIKAMLAMRGSATTAADAGAKGEQGVINREIASNGANFQVKSADQIERTLSACLGEARTVILPEMVQGGAAPVPAAVPGVPPVPAAASVGFLDPSFLGKADIIQAQLVVFNGDQSALRAGIRSDGATFSYLTALVNVANSVAYNCELERRAGDKSGLCSCETPEKAGLLLQRCLPNVNNNTPEFKSLELDFAQKCALDRKAALASLIGSFAFAKSP